MYLIERLEADRQYAEEALHKETQRKRILESEVDSIILWKQEELALAVQKGLCQHFHQALIVRTMSQTLYFILYIFYTLARARGLHQRLH